MNIRLKSFYLPLALYIIGLNIIIVTAVAVFHELGHALLGLLYGCENISVTLFDDALRSTYTRMTCTNQPGDTAMLLSSFLLLLPVSGLFFTLRRFKERYIGHILLGVSILAAAQDTAILFPSTGMTVLTVLIGGVIAVYGEDRLIHGIIATEIVSNGSSQPEDQ